MGSLPMGLDYAAMSNAELKQYFLRHGDRPVFQAYLDKINSARDGLLPVPAILTLMKKFKPRFAKS
jgi:hypothetical protein